MVGSASNVSVGGRELGVNVDGWVREKLQLRFPRSWERKNIGQRTHLSRCAISN